MINPHPVFVRERINRRTQILWFAPRFSRFITYVDIVCSVSILTASRDKKQVLFLRINEYIRFTFGGIDDLTKVFKFTYFILDLTFINI